MGEQEPPPPPEEPGAPPGWTRLLRPFRSEDAAFRLVLWVAGAFAVLAAVVLLVRAL